MEKVNDITDHLSKATTEVSNCREYIQISWSYKLYFCEDYRLILGRPIWSWQSFIYWFLWSSFLFYISISKAVSIVFFVSYMPIQKSWSYKGQLPLDFMQTQSFQVKDISLRTQSLRVAVHIINWLICFCLSEHATINARRSLTGYEIVFINSSSCGCWSWWWRIEKVSCCAVRKTSNSAPISSTTIQNSSEIRKFVHTQIYSIHRNKMCLISP